MEERLRKFAYLVDAGSFTKASLELRISQPALSAAINKLERELRTELLVHGSRSLQLTKAGKLAYDSAKELGMVSSNLRTRLTELSTEQPNVFVGMIDSVASVLFASATNVDELERHAKLSVIVNNSRYLAEAIRRDELDVAFITDKPTHHGAAFITEFVAKEPFVVVSHAADANNVQASVDKGVLPNFVSYDHASATRRIVDEALQRLGIIATPTYFSTSPEVALRLVLLRKGVAALPYVLIKDLLSDGELSLVGAQSPVIIERPISTIRRRGKLLASPLITMANQVSLLFETYHAEARNVPFR